MAEIVIGRVLHSAAHDAIHKNVDHTVDRSGLNSERNPDLFVLFELHRQLGLLRTDLGILGSDFEASAAGQAGHDNGVVVPDIVCSHLHLNGCTG